MGLQEVGEHILHKKMTIWNLAKWLPSRLCNCIIGLIVSTVSGIAYILRKLKSDKKPKPENKPTTFSNGSRIESAGEIGDTQGNESSKRENAVSSLNNVESTMKIKQYHDKREYDPDANDPVVQKRLRQLNAIAENAETWHVKVSNFNGDRKSYLHIREMLLRIIDEVDLVYSGGKDIIREEKRFIVAYVQRELEKLESDNKNF